MRTNKKYRVVEINENQTKDKISDDIIWILTFVISLIHGLMCISQGILSSCVTEIKKELHLSDEEFGMFGTISGFGSLIGSLIFTLIIERVSHKYLICTMLLINSVSHFAFFFKFNYTLLLFSRLISGYASVFCYIYFPMWVDEFGIKDWLNFMQTIVQVSNTIGHILGYFIYYIIGSSHWKYGFLTETFTVSCLVLVMIFIPETYYDKVEVEYESTYNIINNDEEMKLKNDNNDSNIRVKKVKNNIMKDIICNLPYMMVSLYRANRLFIFVAIDFWFSDYLQSVLSIHIPSEIFFSYSFTIVLSPLLGLILGGIISNKIGGPKGKHSFKAMFLLQIGSVFFGFLASCFQNINYFTIFMSFYMLLNTASGLISISASYAVVPKNLIGTATGVYSIIVNLFGFLPAPYAYAFLKTIFGSGRYIMIFFMVYGLIGGMDLILADIYMKRQKIFIHKEELTKNDKGMDN